MAIGFSADDRKGITRRQVKIDLENFAFQTSMDSFTSQSAQLLQVDEGNKKIYAHFDSICQDYEDEATYLHGAVPARYTESDVVANAQSPHMDPFFPVSSTIPYTKMIPCINDAAYTNNKVKGFFHPTSTNARYEPNILSNGNEQTGLQQMINRLNSGISSSYDVSTTIMTDIPAGDVVGGVAMLWTSWQFLAGDIVYIGSGTACGIYQIVSITLSNLVDPNNQALIVYNSIVPSLVGIAYGSVIINHVAAFTPTERQTMSAYYQEILVNITNNITSLLTELKTNLNGQLTAVTANSDARGTQAGQNTTAISNLNSAISTITTWQALSTTGANGKFTTTKIQDISTMAATRVTQSPARLSQVTIALGTNSATALSQSGDTFSGQTGSPYYDRYKWLNIRINRSTGSLRRYYSAGESKVMLQHMYDNNIAIKAEYAAYFLTKSVTFNDGTDIVHIKDTNGIGISDTVYIVSETQPEISRTVLQILGSTQLKLSSAIPVNYETSDMARVFKPV
jgi:hypothetical protein